ncbi:uncharacterized protein EURHEDRAFT_511783 [Aspergillus ruber CBS 135680]|uniref:SWIM-type domain-containing protein n=1 Tax=Aspergillus ruber (strain CBS 135680) TaxID=1388766 RepID=A0A017STH3_ASPRC|nr:uncharacterized protein EURHEDRAFT_511783 [Aspergillus ruber CBS 135680]EYE99565.1 hypothetical protein EURHEDRAFT_511783 [Aspergillus ruber CBS 135680]
MEIPDSDEEEEELLPDTVQDEDPELRNQHISSPVQFVERIFFQLNKISSTPHQHHNHHCQHDQQQNPFSTISNTQASQVRPLMLALHCLFPNELLLALDILDRGLVRRLVRGNQEKSCDLEVDTPFPFSSFPHGLSSSQAPFMVNSGKEPVEDVFLVISASSSASIFTSTATRHEGVKGYEVRLSAWNCTCPTFILSAFRGEASSNENYHHDQSDDDYTYGNSASVAGQGCTRTYRFGGTLTHGPTKLSPPSCKHLMACFILARCPNLFGIGEGAESYRVSAKELAGWCGGWGG